MNEHLKKYELSDNALENVPIGSAEESNFDKHKRHNAATTWLTISNNTMHYVTQFNKQGKYFAGYLPEPYKLFLKFAKETIENSKILEKELGKNIGDEFQVNSKFKIQILEQQIFDSYLSSKINSIVLLIMSVESFINTIIPHDITIEGISKIDIEKQFSLKDKFNRVIPIFKNIVDIKIYQNLYSEILQLNQLRNNFVHLKTSYNEANMDPYIKDFEKILKLDLYKEYQKIKKLIDLINKYQNIC